MVMSVPPRSVKAVLRGVPYAQRDQITAGVTVMCFYCPACLTLDDGGIAIRVARIAETIVCPTDVTQDPETLAGFQSGERFLMALQATLYIQNRPVATETIHGITESDLPGEISCAFDDTHAVGCLMSEVRNSASATGYLRDGQWVLC